MHRQSLNPEGKGEPEGKEFSMRELGELGFVDKLKTRLDLIKRGLL